MAATNRADKVKLLLKTLQKRYKHHPKPQERSLLECLMFAACLENASFDAAESAYSVLDHHYIDWNEIRVSTPQEIADTLPMLPQPLEAGERIKKTLQWVFETTYMFDLEEYRKKTIGQVVEYLDSIPSCSPFMINYLVQIGLGGHQIPLDEGAMRILRRLDLTRVHNGREEVAGIERLVTKTKGIEFATLMHMFGIEFFDRQDDGELASLLAAIDKSAPGRSWREPEGVVRKADVKPAVSRPAAAGAGNFKPVIDLDDEEETDPAAAGEQEESIEFIDTGLAALGNGSSVDGNGAAKKSKKSPAAEKTGAKKKTSDADVTPEKSEPKEAPVPKTDSRKKDKDTAKPAAKKPAVAKADNKPVKEKPASTPKKAETKKSASAKKEAKKPETKTPKKPAKEATPGKAKKSDDSKTPKKSAKTPPRSATKKLQQKKPR